MYYQTSVQYIPPLAAYMGNPNESFFVGTLRVLGFLKRVTADLPRHVRLSSLRLRTQISDGRTNKRYCLDGFF